MRAYLADRVAELVELIRLVGARLEQFLRQRH